ncbi:MAG: 4Fe-4S ferredoxin [Candidatus Aminicenantes bacterium RBG_16_63_16]|nr:MAG: 4Fe-4S ferredoxin [Candidatus Aminicenantes bacterium RBG_16_63_16]
MKSHAVLAAGFLKDAGRARWHDEALWYVREKRDRLVRSVPGWEELRDTAHAIKRHALANLSSYLEEFERNAAARGAVVHYAADAGEHNRMILDILRARGARLLAKSKSMLTEECGLNDFLESNGVEVVETDLGERIIQFARERPSHIVMPAIHKKKEEVGEIFHRHLGTAAGESDPTALTRAARVHLREKFLAAPAGLSGVNFAVAETGAIIICTNEGNADLVTSLPDVHIAVMGVEKLIPRSRDLSVFLRLLARSATGQPVTAYTSHLLGPRPGQEMHIVIVDNGRSDILKSARFHRAAFCLRCAACLNTCPVFRRSGGHTYNYVIPGPIGTILAPHRDLKKYKDMPFASSLCGSCSAVCPVKIDIHRQIVLWRNEIVEAGYLGRVKSAVLKTATAVMRNARIFTAAGALGRRALRLAPRFFYNNRLTIWGKTRDLPQLPARSFRSQYKAYRKTGKAGESRD